MSTQNLNFFTYKNLLVDFKPKLNTYRCKDNMIGFLIGYFQFDEGPGWVFMAKGGLIMDELPALAELWMDLQSTIEES